MIDKGLYKTRKNFRIGSDEGNVSGRQYDKPSAPAPSAPRSSPFSGGEDRQQYSAIQTQTGAVKGGGPKGTTSFVGGDRGRDSRDEFIRNVQKTNPSYTPGPPRNNFFSRTLGAGLNYAKKNPQNILLGLMNPGLGAIGGIFSFLNNPEMRKRLTGYETQAEYEQARQNRINLKTIETLQNTIQKKYLDKGRSLDETNLDERLAGLRLQMGITPNTAADLRPDLDFSNEAELAFEGIGSLDTGNQDLSLNQQPLIGTDRTVLSDYDNYLEDAPLNNPLSLEEFSRLQALGRGGILDL